MIPQSIAALLPAGLLSRLLVTSSGCWEWQGCRGRGGYGLWTDEGRLQPVHRVVYKRVVGPLIRGLVVMHDKCDNPPCANPDHLLQGTQKKNITDMYLRGRQADFYPKKLTPEEARALRDEARSIPLYTKGSNAALAAKYGISERSVREVRFGRTWRGLEAS